MSVPERMQRASQFHYVTVGHVTIDVLADGTRRPGGAAFYSALQAARLGARATILTRGVPAEIERALDPHRDELELRVQPAPETTTFATEGLGESRRQRILSWAGAIDAREIPPAFAGETGEAGATLLHLAPVADELAEPWLARRPAAAAFLGLTPQGLLRSWEQIGSDVRLTTLAPAPGIAGACDAVVLSAEERVHAGSVLEAALAAGASVAVTAGTRPTRLLAGGQERVLAAREVARPREDLGAGDVFAATFFLALATGGAPAEAAEVAAAAAAVRVLGEGAGAVADWGAIERRLAALAEGAGGGAAH